MKRSDFFFLSFLIASAPHWSPLFGLGYAVPSLLAWLFFLWKGK